jgi:hypothetical protein
LQEATECINAEADGLDAAKAEAERVAADKTAKDLEIPEPVKCKCGATMIQKTASQGDNTGRRYLACPNSTQETRAQHDFKWIEAGE